MSDTSSDSIRDAVLKQQFEEFSSQIPKAYLAVAVATAYLFWQFNDQHPAFISTMTVAMYGFLALRLYRIFHDGKIDLPVFEVRRKIRNTSGLAFVTGSMCSVICFILGMGANPTELLLLGSWNTACCMGGAIALSAIPRFPQLLIGSGMFPFQMYLLVTGTEELKAFAIISITGAALVLTLGERVSKLLSQLTLEKADQKQVALAAEAELNNFIETVDKISWRSDEKNNLVFASENSEDVFGIPSKLLINRNPHKILLLASGENETASTKTRKMIEAHEPIRDINFITTRRNKKLWFTLNGEPRFDEAGHFNGYIGWIVDITKYVALNSETRRQQERLRLFENMGRGWDWTTDTSKRFTFISPRSIELTGVDCTKFENFKLDPMDCPDREQRLHMTNALMSEQPIIDVTMEYKARNGHTFRITTSGLPNHDENGHFIGYSGLSYLVGDKPPETAHKNTA